MRVKVVAIGMINSIHFARWLSQFKDENVDFFILSSTPTKKAHEIIESLSANSGNANFFLTSNFLTYSKIFWAADLLFSRYFRGSVLRKLIKNNRPDFVHAIEIQHAGYAALRALRTIRAGGCKLIITNYGSDIYWFKNFKSHNARIKKLLRNAEFYSAECRRDIALAIELGFRGKTLPVIPNAGGFEESYLKQDTPPLESRKLILVKGYQGWVGRANDAILAIENIAQEISEFSIVVFSCNLRTLRLIRKVNRRSDLDILGYGKGALTHDQMLGLFRQSRIYVGVSLSDGISTSVLEALASGCFPIQSDTSCAGEWFEDGRNGLLIREINAKHIEEKILEGLELSAQAFSESRKDELLIRLGKTEVSKKAFEFYGLPR